jgi:hypothetical protein
MKYMMENKKNVWNHQPDIVGCYISHIPIKKGPLPPLLYATIVIASFQWFHSHSKRISKELISETTRERCILGSVPHQTSLWNLLWALSWTRSCWGDGKVTRIGKIGWSSIPKGHRKTCLPSKHWVCPAVFPFKSRNCWAHPKIWHFPLLSFPQWISFWLAMLDRAIYILNQGSNMNSC